MNLLHVISSMDPRNGGPCQGIRNLAPQVMAQGNTVEVVCLDDPGAEYLHHESIPVHALGKGRGVWSYHPAFIPWLSRNLPRFDAVILNGLWQYPGYALSKATHQRPGLPPYFIFPHGMLDPWFQRAPERRWKAIRNWFYWKLIEQRVVRRAGALFFTCAEELRLARETFRPYQPQREINVGYGVAEPPEYHPRMAAVFAEKCPGVNGRPYFLFLSRIHPKKGIELLIKAYASVYGTKTENRKLKAENGGLRPAGVGPGATLQPSTFDLQPLQTPALVIAGPGLETDYGREMQRLAESLCPKPSTLARGQSSEVGNQLSTFNFQLSTSAPSVLFPGMLTGDAKWGAFYNSEAFVLPSHQENFGIAVVESLACSRPVLISNQINIWREIADDKAGLVEDDTLAGTERLFQKWSNLSREEKEMMSCAAKLNFENRFSIEFAATKLMAALEKGIARSRKQTTQPIQHR